LSGIANGSRMIDPAELIYDRLLVLRAQAGDEAAFAELVERFSPRLRYFLRKLLGPADEAEDALQDVWLDVLRHLPRLDDPQALVAWLYRIARDRAFGRLRKLRRIEKPLDEAGVIDPATAEENDFSPEDAARIHAALDALPHEQREVLVLRFLEEMSYDEIARVVGCQVGTVRSRIHYGKRALRRALET
jgi:RNA polymerase sigma-70 factor (ECF subfamily)